MRPLRLLLAPLVLVSPLAAGCGQDSPAVPKSAIAVVGDRTITRAQFDALMSQAKGSYTSRGKPFPAAGTRAYAALKASAVRLLVERAELEQKAPGLGVTIGNDQVEARRKQLIDETFGGSDKRYRARLQEEGMTDDQVRSALRAQLLSEAVFQAVTVDVAVSTAVVQRYYEDHIEQYSTSGQATPFAAVRESIRGRLLAEKRTRTFKRWLEGVQAEFAARTAYAEGFAPPDGG
jgi:parvulin-like peptidyl-prolyl isomerase